MRWHPKGCVQLSKLTQIYEAIKERLALFDIEWVGTGFPGGWDPGSPKSGCLKGYSQTYTQDERNRLLGGWDTYRWALTKLVSHFCSNPDDPNLPAYTWESLWEAAGIPLRVVPGDSNPYQWRADNFRLTPRKVHSDPDEWYYPRQRRCFDRDFDLNDAAKLLNLLIYPISVLDPGDDDIWGQHSISSKDGFTWAGMLAATPTWRDYFRVGNVGASCAWYYPNGQPEDPNTGEPNDIIEGNGTAQRKTFNAYHSSSWISQLTAGKLRIVTSYDTRSQEQYRPLVLGYSDTKATNPGDLWSGQFADLFTTPGGAQRSDQTVDISSAKPYWSLRVLDDLTIQPHEEPGSFGTKAAGSAMVVLTGGLDLIELEEE